MFEEIPDKMKFLNQWVLWIYEDRNGKKTKIPYQTNGKKADTKNPKTWTSFENVLKAFSEGLYDGIGFAFSKVTGIMGVDFDHIRNPETGEWNSDELKDILSLNSYAEISPSGSGAHVICLGKIPGARRRSGNHEMYDSGRYFTVTGETLPECPKTIVEVQPAINKLYEKWFKPKSIKSASVDVIKLSDSEILEKCNRAKNAAAFKQLYAGKWKLLHKSQSEAELSLCSFFAFYTQDQEQIGRLVAGSGLYREKWDRSDYRSKTISEAIAGLDEKYSPEKRTLIVNASKIQPSTFEEIALEIMENIPLFVMGDTGEFYIYRDGVYTSSDAENELKRIIRETSKRMDIEKGIPDPKPITINGIGETLAYIQSFMYKPRRETLPGIDIINFKNGLYDRRTKELKPHTPEYLSTVQIPVTYDPDADCPQIKKFLSEVVPEKDCDVLLEFAGYSLIPDTRFQKALFIQGEGSNGKSVFLNLLTRFIGDSNASGESLQTLENDRFASSTLEGKLLNVFPDLPSTTLYQNSMFKALVGGDLIRGEKKYRPGYIFQNYARLLYSANKLPIVKDESFAFFRRMLLVTFPTQFAGKEADPYLLDKLTTETELSGFLNLALDSLDRLFKNGEFTYSKTADDIELLYLIRSDHIEAFIRECVFYSADDISKPDMFDCYTSWCRLNKVSPVKENEFGKRFKIKGFLDTRTQIEGIRQRYWLNTGVRREKCKTHNPVSTKNDQAYQTTWALPSQEGDDENMLSGQADQAKNPIVVYCKTENEENIERIEGIEESYRLRIGNLRGHGGQGGGG